MRRIGRDGIAIHGSARFSAKLRSEFGNVLLGKIQHPTAIGLAGRAVRAGNSAQIAREQGCYRGLTQKKQNQKQTKRKFRAADAGRWINLNILLVHDEGLL